MWREQTEIDEMPLQRTGALFPGRALSPLLLTLTLRNLWALQGRDAGDEHGEQCYQMT